MCRVHHKQVQDWQVSACSLCKQCPPVLPVTGQSQIARIVFWFFFFLFFSLVIYTIKYLQLENNISESGRIFRKKKLFWYGNNLVISKPNGFKHGSAATSLSGLCTCQVWCFKTKLCYNYTSVFKKKKLMENLTAGNCFLHTWMTQKQLNGVLQSFTKNVISRLRQGMRNNLLKR